MRTNIRGFMQLKNIGLVVLIITNSITGYLLYQHRGVIVSRESVLTHFGIEEDDQYAQMAKDYIFSLYADVIFSCGATVTAEKRSSFTGNPSAEMACLLAGKRTVIWETMQNVKYDFENQYEMFKILAKSEGIREIHRVSFSPEGERDALLLTKAELIRDTGDRTDNGINPYLFGLLLGYDLKDIEFYYQRSRFMADYEGDVPFSYVAFSKDLKNKFESFMKVEWLQSGGIADFEKDKNDALEWIKEQDVYSIDELYQQIEELKHIQTLARIA